MAEGVDGRRSPWAPGRLSAPSDWKVERFAPNHAPAWDKYVLAHPEGTLFHTQAWRTAVKSTFGHEDIYLIALSQDRIVGLLPLFLVASRLMGRMLVSVPYGVAGGIIADDDRVAAALLAEARRIADDRGCPIIDLRSERACLPGLPVVDRYFGFHRNLPDREEDVLEWLPRKARAAARNAREKFKLTYTVGDEHLPEVWRLYSISMRRLGSPNYPCSFFQQVVAATPNRHWVSLVHWNGRPVAGLVTLLYRDRVMPYFVGATAAASRCHAANFHYWKTMEAAAAAGFRVFDFGRSRRDNLGSLNFKRFHGFQPQALGYQRFTAPGCTPTDLTPSSAKIRWARAVWTRLPLWFTQVVGARVSHHIPG